MGQPPTNDSCGGAAFLMEGEQASYCDNAPAQPTTTNATGDSSFCFGATENSVWYQVKGDQGGDAEIRISNIDSTPNGLEMQIFASPTCNCNNLNPVPGSCKSATGPNGTITDTITTLPTVCYYILIDGMSGNEEDFNIQASDIDANAIVAKPVPFITVDNNTKCVGDTFNFENLTFENGGTVTYAWDFYNNGSNFSHTKICSGNDPGCTDSDTGVVYNTYGNYIVWLRSVVQECGEEEFAVKSITVEDLVPAIDTLGFSCANTPTGFVASATTQPGASTPPIAQWEWTFYQSCDTTTITDPSATNPDTTFYTPCSFDPNVKVRLVAFGPCGPDTIIQTFGTFDSALIVSAPDTAFVCQGDTVSFCATVDSTTGQAPYSFSWSGPVPSNPPDSNCTSVSGLSPGVHEYVVEVTDANGCKAFDTVHVVVTKPDIISSLITTPSPSCSGPPGYCVNDSVSFEYEITTGTPPFTIVWQPEQGLHDTLQNMGSAMIDTAYARVDTTTSYDIIVIDGDGCRDTTTLNISIHPPPTVTTTPVCENDTSPVATFCVVGSCPGSNYDWSISPADSLLNSTTDSCVEADFTGMPAGDYNFGVIVDDATTGCVDTVNFTYTLDSPITFTLSATDTNICEDECAILSVSGDTAGVTYDWYDESSLIASDTTAVEVCPNDTTKYFVIADRGASCRTIDSITINVDTIPEAIAALSPDTVCACDSIQLDGTGSTAGVNIIYRWRSQAGNTIVDSTALTTTAFPCTDDTFTLNVIDTASGCSDDSSVTVIANPLPAAVANADPDTICEADTTVNIQLDGTGSGTGTNITYQWTANRPITINNSDSIIANADVDTTTTFTLTVTDTSTGCDSAVSVQVFAHLQPKVVPDVIPDSVCACDSVTLDGSGSSMGPSNFALWQSVNGNSIDNINSYVTQAEACVSDTFILSVADVNTGCINDSTVTVDVFPIPAADAQANPDSFCEQVLTTITLDGTNSDTGTNIIYSWTSNRGVAISDSDSIVATSQIDTTTTFYITVTDTTIGCSNMDSVVVNMYPAPVVAASAQDSVCECDTVTLDGTGSATGGNIVYDWQSRVGNNILDTTALITDAIVCDTDTFRLRVTNTTTGCFSDSSVIVGITPAPAIATDITPDTVCVGEMDTITLDGTGSATGTDIVYEWTSNPPVTIINSDSIIATAHTDDATDFILKVTDTSTGCVNIDTARLHGYPQPVAEVNPDSLCFQGSTNITLDGSNSDTGANIIHQWSSVPPVPISPADSIVATATIDSTTTFILTVNDTVGGCISTDTAVVTVLPVPVAAAVPLDTACECDTVPLDGTGSSTGGNIVYDWQSAVGNTILDTSALVTSAVACNTDTFTLTVTDTTFGCFSDTQITVDVFPIPNVETDASPDSFCRQGMTTISLDGTGSSTGGSIQYSWTADRPVTINDADSIEATAQIDTTTTFTLTVTDTLSGCDSSESVTVTIFPNPQVVATVPDTACACDTITLDGTGSSTGPSFVNLWTSAVGNSIADSSALTTTAVACATDTFTLTITDTTSGCTNDSSVEVEVFPKPNVDVAVSPDTICGGTSDTIRLDGTGSSTGGDIQYSWSANPPAISLMDSDSIVAQAVVDTTTTFTLTVTDTVSGCDSSESATVFAYSDIIAAIDITPNDFCRTDTTVTLDGTGSSNGPNIVYTWTSSPAVPITDADSIIAQASVDSTTVFTLTVEDTVSGCTEVNTDTLTMDPIPDVAVAPVDSVCACDTITLNGTGTDTGLFFTYFWQSANGNTIFDNDTTVTGATACVSDTFTLFVGNVNTGCINDSSIFVNVNPLPSAQASASPDTFCEQGLVTVTLDGTGSSTGDSIKYNWTANRPVTINDADSIIATSQIDTTTTFTLTVTDTTVGCDSSMSVKVVVNPRPEVSVTPVDSACECEAISLDGTGSSTGSGFAYTWESSNGSAIVDSTALTTTAFPCTDDTFTLTVTDTATGCFRDSSFDVTVFPVPAAVANVSNDTFCIGNVDTITLDGTGSTTGNTIKYNWSATPPAVYVQDTDSIIAQAVIDTTTTFTLTVTDTVFGCDSTTSVTVVVNPKPVISTQVTDSICGCSTIALDGTGSSSGANYTYLWQSATGSSIADSSNLVTSALVCATDTFTLTITDTLTGCVSDTTEPVEAFPVPAAVTAVSPDTICKGDTAAITLDGTGSATGSNFIYNWTANPVVSITNADSIVASASVDTTTVFTLTVTDTTSGCDSSSSVRIVVNEGPRATAAPVDSVCQCDQITLDGTGSSSGNNYQYAWTSASGNFIANPDSLVTTATACNDDVFTLTIVDTTTGCIGDTSIVVDMSPKPLINTDLQPDTICPGQTTTIRLDGTGSQTGSFITYNWSSSGTSVTNADSIIASATISNSTQFTFRVIDTTSGCFANQTQMVNTYNQPNLQTDDNNFCYKGNDKTANLCVSNTNGGAAFDWSISADTSLFISSPLSDSCETVDLDGQPNGGYMFGVSVSNPRTGCAYNDTVTLNVLPPLVTAAGPDTLLYTGETVELFATGGVSYSWSPDSGLSDPNIDDPIAQPKSSTVYTVEIDSSGCLGYDTVTIQVIDSLDCFVPNAFTPNGDGLNDQLLLHCIGNSEVVSFKIFNRWGETVYRANSRHDATQVGWDGTYKGKPQEVDSYAYILILKDPDGEVRGPFSGSITLIR